ncbi:MAG: STAS domain-containing protein [Oceanospirillales bacterium]|uniref:Anti-sigma factor antagonist n=1 Tax=Marinobacter litoralis TaxID=187981 RepID=A0A3M2RJW5_9GAMM|nr:STAS domain-containing protein [Marinobacter litoralis]MBR9885863.1 STAS domain-containing protein [Oceanospirillales bacterium]RMJ05626.1 putative anti-sigma factor antagonist BtrV [Marinobacter litoralis]
MSLEISVIQQSDEALGLKLDGSVDSDTAPELEAMLDDMVHPSVTYLALNMSGVSFISSAGLRVVFKMLKQMKARDGQLMVTEMNPGVEKVFEVVKLMPDLSVFGSSEEMDEYLTSLQKQQNS